MGCPELAGDERYATHVARGRHQTELDDLIADWTRTLTVDELEALMIEHSIPAGKIYRAADMLEDPHFAAREALVEMDSPRWGKFRMQNSFPKMSDTPGSIRSLAPAEIGQHNAEIYGALLGLDQTELDRLSAAGVI
jgi:formyl-CoA transferase